MILDLITNLLGAIKAVFGFTKQRDAEKNSPAMVEAKTAQNEQNAEDKTRRAIAGGNIQEERRELAE